MKITEKIISAVMVAAFIISLFGGSVYAGSSRTWSNIGKGLAIYEGVKVLTGREGNIVDDVTGGMRPRGSSSGNEGSYTDGYSAGYKEGYEAGYNVGFRHGVEQASK